MPDWDTIFKEKGKVFLEADVNMPKVIKFLKERNAQKVLDLGCGTGRHTVLLAKEGFDVYGMDISETALRITQEELDRENLEAHLTRASCYETFPYHNNSFDAIISSGVIHHNYHDQIKFCISEIERVLRPKGVIFSNFATNKSQEKRGQKKRKEIAPHTYIPLEGQEKGIVHFFYTQEQIKKDFKNFKILETYLDSTGHNCLLGLKN